MRIAVTGSIATDHLMLFPGRFSEQLVPDRLAAVSLSFLADELDIRYGGVAANIAYGLGALGRRPLLVGAAGRDFGEYRGWLEAAGVDTAQVRVSDSRYTARFVCTTDADQNQIATFYSGAMAEAADIDLEEVLERAGGADFVLVGPDDPTAMLRHAAACRRLGLPFAADPSQQLARMTAADVTAMIEGARYLFTNSYERALLLRLVGRTASEVLERVGAWIVTLGQEGVRIDTAGSGSVHLPAVPAASVTDPTGAGDAFRAGFLVGLLRGLGDRASAQLGATLATMALEFPGSQGYRCSESDLIAWSAQHYDVCPMPSSSQVQR
ncbi:carbohydrate kinase family protein [Streptomyces sp. NPDC006602]|uniref:carbohydrate kinase family protein n=1 Tax=Streptomyces sp. NPDC006602 TaxID=3364751 RepID=UPI0036C59BDD